MVKIKSFLFQVSILLWVVQSWCSGFCLHCALLADTERGGERLVKPLGHKGDTNALLPYLMWFSFILLAFASDRCLVLFCGKGNYNKLLFRVVFVYNIVYIYVSVATNINRLSAILAFSNGDLPGGSYLRIFKKIRKPRNFPHREKWDLVNLNCEGKFLSISLNLV